MNILLEDPALTDLSPVITDHYSEDGLRLGVEINTHVATERSRALTPEQLDGLSLLALGGDWLATKRLEDRGIELPKRLSKTELAEKQAEEAEQVAVCLEGMRYFYKERRKPGSTAEIAGMSDTTPLPLGDKLAQESALA
jgi:hypothetical protein